MHMMRRIAKFEKISYDQFKKDWLDTFAKKYDGWDEDVIDKVIHDIYMGIELPKRSTSGSAGYDFFCPANLTVVVGNSVKIPTGIRCKMDNGWVLKIYPRSGLGFKTGIHLANGVGIIDADYYHADNEGHVQIKLVNDSALAKIIDFKSGDAFCQGVFVPFGVTVDDDADGVRTGGFGSTDKQ